MYMCFQGPSSLRATLLSPLAASPVWEQYLTTSLGMTAEPHQMLDVSRLVKRCSRHGKLSSVTFVTLPSPATAGYGSTGTWFISTMLAATPAPSVGRDSWTEHNMLTTSTATRRCGPTSVHIAVAALYTGQACVTTSVPSTGICLLSDLTNPDGDSHLQVHCLTDSVLKSVCLVVFLLLFS